MDFWAIFFGFFGISWNILTLILIQPTVPGRDAFYFLST
jgi:hypothetical protein